MCIFLLYFTELLNFLSKWVWALILFNVFTLENIEESVNFGKEQKFAVTAPASISSGKWIIHTRGRFSKKKKIDNEYKVAGGKINLDSKTFFN